MLRPYLGIWDWDLIFGRAVKAISSPSVPSLCLFQQTVLTVIILAPSPLEFSDLPPALLLLMHIKQEKVKSVFYARWGKNACMLCLEMQVHL